MWFDFQSRTYHVLFYIIAIVINMPISFKILIKISYLLKMITSKTITQHSFLIMIIHLSLLDIRFIHTFWKENNI